MNLFAGSAAQRDNLRNVHFGFVFQFYHLLPELTALENVLLPAMVRYSVLGWLGQRSKLVERADELLELVQLTPRASDAVKTLSRGMVEGSTRKAYRQKGTGRARRGDMKTNIMRGGGMAFRKDPRDFGRKLPRKMRRRALQSAILAKMLGNDLMVVEGLKMDAPKTAAMAGVLKNLKINRSCLLALAERDANIHLSSRNLPDLTVRVAAELNAFDVATRQKMLVTREAMQALTQQEARP